MGLRPRNDGFLVTIAVGLALQGVFLVARGNVQSLQPVCPREIIFPSVVGALMLAILFASMFLALGYQLDGNPDIGVFHALLGLSWVFWGIVFFILCSSVDYLRAVRRIVLSLIGGSLVELLATIPSHMIVIKHPGCYLGRWPVMCLAGGLSVLLWAFGPGIVLLFMYEARKRRAGHCPGCGYILRGLTKLRCPECGRPFTLREVRMKPEELALDDSGGGEAQRFPR